MDKNEPVRLYDVAEALARLLDLKYDELSGNSFVKGMIDGTVMGHLTFHQLDEVNAHMRHHLLAGHGYANTLDAWIVANTELIKKFAIATARILRDKETP